MAPPLLSLISWLRGLFRRPGELLEFFGGCATLGWVVLAWNRGHGAMPSIELLARLMPEECWLWFAGGAALAQLIALGANQHIARFIAAICVGSWYAMLAFALSAQLGPATPMLSMYAMAAAMNAYVVLHVLEGRLR